MKELLVITQDTSAYGVDVKYRTGFWDGKPVKTHMLDLVREARRAGAAVRRLGAPALRLPVSARRRGHPADGRRATCCLTSTCRSSTAHPDVLKRMKRPANGEKNLERIARWREMCPDLSIRSTFIAGFPGETEAEFEYLLRLPATKRRSTAPAASPIRRSRAPPPTSCPIRCPTEVREERRARFMAAGRGSVARSACSAASARPCRCWSTRATRSAARAGSAAATPMRRRSTAWCTCCRPRRPSKTLKVGEFAKARIVAADGHDLIGMPV